MFKTSITKKSETEAKNKKERKKEFFVLFVSYKKVN
jgi:hypothetical protein